MCEFLPGPSEKACTVVGEPSLQLVGRAHLLDHSLPLVREIEINEGETDFRQRFAPAQQRAVDSQLGPVNGPMTPGHPLQVAAIGLELLQTVGSGVVAVGATANQQIRRLPAEGDLRFITVAAAAGDCSVAFHPLARRGRRREAKVEVTRLGGEIAQSAHRNGILSGLHGIRA